MAGRADDRGESMRRKSNNNHRGDHSAYDASIETSVVRNWHEETLNGGQGITFVKLRETIENLHVHPEATGLRVPARCRGRGSADLRGLVQRKGKCRLADQASAGIDLPPERWFWLDNNDLRSKPDFLFLMVFAALVESRSIPQFPLVTISAGR